MNIWTGLQLGAWLALCLLLFYWYRREKSRKNKQTLLRFSSQRELEANLQGIIEDLSLLCKDNPKLTHPYLVLGNLYRICGESQRSLMIHQNLLTESSLTKTMQDRLRIEIANDLIALGHEENAYEQLTKIPERSDFFISAQEKLVELHYKKHDFAAAHQCMTIILQKRSNWRNTKRTAYFAALAADQSLAAGDIPSAQNQAKKALSVDNQCILAIYVQGSVHLLQHEYDQAIEHFGKILQVNPDFAFLALPKIEDAYYGKQSFMRMGERLQELSSIYPNNLYIMYSLGKYWRKKKMLAEAQRCLAAALEINPTYMPARQEMLHTLQTHPHDNPITTAYQDLMDALDNRPRFICSNCQHAYEQMTWHCTSCGRWESIQANHAIVPHITDEAAPQPYQASHS